MKKTLANSVAMAALALAFGIMTSSMAAKTARLELEKKTGRSVISPLNASDAVSLHVEEQGLLPPKRNS